MAWLGYSSTDRDSRIEGVIWATPPFTWLEAMGTKCENQHQYIDSTSHINYTG